MLKFQIKREMGWVKMSDYLPYVHFMSCIDHVVVVWSNCCGVGWVKISIVNHIFVDIAWQYLNIWNLMLYILYNRLLFDWTTDKRWPFDRNPDCRSTFNNLFKVDNLRWPWVQGPPITTACHRARGTLCTRFSCCKFSEKSAKHIKVEDLLNNPGTI